MGDRLTLEGWLANKTLKNMQAWITMIGSVMVLAEREGRWPASPPSPARAT